MPTIKEQLKIQHANIMKQIKELNNNPYLFKDAGLLEQRTRLYYQAYCVDAKMHDEYPVPFDMYMRGI